MGFNERFAQPSGTLSTRVLNRAKMSVIKAAPRVFYTTTAWDYWGGGAYWGGYPYYPYPGMGFGMGTSYMYPRELEPGASAIITDDPSE